MPDAAEYGDAGTDTMGHISESVDEFHIPNLQKLGIANLHPLKQVAPVERPMGYYSFLKEASTGKDTMTGHWEMMGLHITKPFKTFTETGFPKELIDELEKRTGHKVIGNKSASGTEILDELAEEEIATGHMIVYTSADSVLQICGNEETFGLDELYLVHAQTQLFGGDHRHYGVAALADVVSAGKHDGVALAVEANDRC